MPPTTKYEKVYALVCEIPSGKVATYGQLAKFVPGCTARMVGYAMASIPNDAKIPWQRVINSQGKVSLRSQGDSHQKQKELLVAEGILFSSSDKIDLGTFRWEGPELEWLEEHSF